MRPITENGTGKTPKKRQHTKRGQKAINGVKKTITKVSQICTIFIKIISNCFESPIHCFKRADLIQLPLFLKPLHHQTKVWFSQQFPKCGLVLLIIVSGPYLFFSKQPFSEFHNINSLNRNNNVVEKKRFSLIPEEMANYVYYNIFIYICMLMKLFPVIVDCDLFPALKCDTSTYLF